MIDRMFKTAAVLGVSVKPPCLCGENCPEKLTTETQRSHRDSEKRNEGTTKIFFSFQIL